MIIDGMMHLEMVGEYRLGLVEEVLEHGPTASFTSWNRMNGYAPLAPAPCLSDSFFCQLSP
jgi:hypothetical protein